MVGVLVGLVAALVLVILVFTLPLQTPPVAKPGLFRRGKLAAAESRHPPD